MPEVYFDFNLINILVALSMFVHATLGILIFLKGKEDKNGQGYLVVILAILLWSFSMISYRSADNTNDSIIWARLLYAMATFAVTGFLYFSFVFLNEKVSFGIYKKLTIAILNGLFLFLSLTELVVKNVFIPEQGEKIIKWGTLYPFYTIYISGMFLWGFINLYRKYRLSEGIEKTQISYVFWGYFIGSNLAVASNLLLPSFNYFKFNWLGQIFTTIMVGFTTYAILKHHLLNIKVITTEIFVILVSMTLLVRTLFSVTPNEIIFNASIFLGVASFGILLIRSVLKEVEQREKLETLTTQLETANTELKRVDAAKSEFVSIVSHQLRTPLTAVKGYISMMIEGTYGKLQEAQSSTLQKVFQSAEHLITLVNDLLNMNRIEEGRIIYEFKSVDIAQMVDDTVFEFKKMAEDKKLKLTWIKPHGLPMAWADADKIRQVVMNFIDNSIKYTAAGSVNVVLKLENDYLVYSVSDTGVGMGPEEKAKLFKKFERGEGGRLMFTGGTGLGLYVAKMMVEAHHGEISGVSAGKDQGSTFSIKIPTEEYAKKNNINQEQTKPAQPSMSVPVK